MEHLRIAVALRAARSALGWNQQEFADKMQVAKSTVARIETMEMAPKADFLTRALALFYQSGVVVDLLEYDRVGITVEQIALEQAKARLTDDTQRRADRRGKRAAAGKNRQKP